jgi:hypothetical protein
MVGNLFTSNSEAMKHDIIKLVLVLLSVLAALFIIDFAFGKFMSKQTEKIIKEDKIGKVVYGFSSANEEVLIVGSSKAMNHYNARLIQDSIGKSVYNLGSPHVQFDYGYCMINTILDRYSPDIIVWEVDLNSLFINHDDMSDLYAFYGRNPYVKEVIDESVRTRLVMLLNAYQYSKPFTVMINNLISSNHYFDENLNGFLPMVRENNTRLEKKAVKEYHNDLFQGRIEKLEQVLNKSSKKGVQLIITASPSFIDPMDNESASRAKIKELCNKFGAVYLDNYYHPLYSDNQELFYDNDHLNAGGADMYSKDFVSFLKTTVQY